VPIPREEAEILQAAPPVTKPRLSIVVVLAMLLGVLLTVLLVSAYFNFQRINALQDEVSLARSALKDKSQAVEEMKAQIEALSKQMSVLKEYSVARSAADRVKKADNSAPVVIGDTPATVPGKDHKNAQVVPTPAKTKKTNPESLNCELVGKSDEEQAATLERCVDVMESTDKKLRPR